MTERAQVGSNVQAESMQCGGSLASSKYRRSMVAGVNMQAESAGGKCTS